MKEYSSIQTITAPIERVYGALSNLEHLRPLIEKAQADDALQAKLAEQGFPNALQSLKDIVVTEDSVSVPGTMLGTLSMSIVERQECRCVKFMTDQSPIRATIWVQLLPENEEITKLKLTIDADIPMMLRPMIGNRFKDGVEKLAQMLAMIKY